MGFRGRGYFLVSLLKLAGPVNEYTYTMLIDVGITYTRVIKVMGIWSLSLSLSHRHTDIATELLVMYLFFLSTSSCAVQREDVEYNWYSLERHINIVKSECMGETRLW